MTKKEFLNHLTHQLTVLSEAERHDILNDYEEHFVAGYELGKSDEEIINSLGTPETIAKEILEDTEVEILASTQVDTTSQRNIGALIALLMFHALFGFWVLFAASMAIGSLLFASVVMLASPILYLVAIPWQGFTPYEFFIGLAMSGCGYFLMLGMWHLGKGVVFLVINHLKYLISLATGGSK